MIGSKLMLGVGAGAIIVIGFLWHNNASLREDLGAYKLAIEQATLTNTNNQTVLDDVTGKLNSCVADKAVDLEANQQTIVNLEARYDELEKQKQRVRIERREIFRDPDCAQLAETDINAVCPNWSVRLRERATAFDQDGDPGSP